MNIELADQIVSDIQNRLRPVPLGLFKIGTSYELITPSRMKRGFHSHLEGCEDYVGTYTSGVTAQQIIDDWS